MLVALTALAGCGGSSTPTPAFAGTPVPGTPQAPDFSLTDQSGARVALAGERGHLVFVTFLYTRCPDVCPLLAQTLGTALRQLGSVGGVRVLAVSVDPAGDTPAAVRTFLRVHRLPSSFRYLTGSREQLQQVWGAYRIAVATASLSSFSAHSAAVYLVDADGRERVLYSPHVQPRDVVHDVRQLMEEPSDG